MKRQDVRHDRLAAKELAQAVRDAAQADGTAEDRLRRAISTTALNGALYNAQASAVIPFYYLKGGMALELRFGLKARASKDVDIGLVHNGPDLLAKFDDVLAAGYEAFSFERKSAKELKNGTWRLEIRVAYHGRPWGTVDVDLVAANYDVAADEVPGIDLARFNLKSGPPVKVLAIERQIGEKLHALSAPPIDGNKPERARDIADLLFCRGQMQLDFTKLQEACEAIFEERKAHDWPPSFVLPDSWIAPLETHLADLGIRLEAKEAVRELHTLIAAIVSKGVLMLKAGYEYRVQRLQLNTNENPVRPDFRIDTSADISALNNSASDGFRIVATHVNPRAGDQLFVVLEREIPNVNQENRDEARSPFLNGTVSHLRDVNQSEWLRGKVKNYGPGPMVDLELRVTGAGEIRVGTLAEQQEADVAIRIDNQELVTRDGFVQFPAIIASYRDASGSYYEQIGPMLIAGRDASNRPSFSFSGFDFPKRVQEAH